MELMDTNLYEIIKKRKMQLSEEFVRKVMFQLFCGKQTLALQYYVRQLTRDNISSGLPARGGSLASGPQAGQCSGECASLCVEHQRDHQHNLL